MTSSFQRELYTACRIAQDAGKLALQYFRTWHGTDPATAGVPVEWKDGDEPVTAADRAVSALCLRALATEFPQDLLVSEELPDSQETYLRQHPHRTWMIDPIDGTKDFIAGRPGFSVMLGLLQDSQPVVGVVYQPLTERLFYAARGQGAFLLLPGSPAEPLHVSTISDLGQARMVSSASHREPLVGALAEGAGIADDMQIGSVGIKLCLIAAGLRDLYVNPAGRTKHWDTSAPAVVLAEAGGLLTNLFGQPLDYHGQLAHPDGLVASNGALHPAALTQLGPLVAARQRKHGTT